MVFFRPGLSTRSELVRRDFEFPSLLEQESFLRMLTALSLRPHLYTPNGTYAEVVLFVDAFSMGAGYPRGVNTGSGMWLFIHWLEESRGKERTSSGGWAAAFLMMFEGDEQQAIANLGPLYEKYLAVPAS